MAPVLTRNEKIIMRVTEWKDVFREKFNQPSAPPSRSPANGTGEIVQSSQMSIASTQIDDTEYVHIGNGGIDYVNGHTPSPTEDYDHEANLTDEGDGTWVGVEDEAPVDDLQDSESETHHDTATANDVEWEEEGRISLDRSSISSSIAPDSSLGGHVAPSSDSHGAHNLRSVHDTHFFQTSIAYKGYVLPIKVPLSTFEGEVGDVSASIHPYLFEH